MKNNDKLLQEFSLLREAIVRIADTLEGIDLKLDDLIETEEYEYSPSDEFLGLEEDEELEIEFDEKNFDEDLEEEQHD